MTVPLEIIEAWGPGGIDKSPTEPRPRALPGVFLMTDSFQTGGSERQFAALAHSLDRSLYRLHLGCIQQKGPFLDGLSEVPQFELGGSLYGFHSLRTRIRLLKHLRSLEISVAHAFDFYTNLTLIPVARLAGVPVVIGSHRQLGDLLAPTQFRVQMAMFRRCDAIVCNSRAAAEVLLAKGITESRLAVIGNGLPDSYFAPAPAAVPRLPGTLRVGMIARMNSAAKNHALFLRAAAIVHQRLPNVEFVLVGDGPLRRELEQQAVSLGLADRIHFLGDRRDIPEVLASIDVSVVPSASESLSNIIIESMAAGIPVIASRVGGNQELVTEDRGILTQAGDEKDLAANIEGLLLNPSMRQIMGENARNFAKANFTIEQIHKQYENLYGQLIERKTKTSRNAIRKNVLPSPLRVSIIAASLNYVGGQSVQADLLLKNWQGDPEVAANLIPIDPEFPTGLKWIGRVPALRTLIREPLYFFALWRGLRKSDLAHIFSASYWSFLIAPAPALLIAKLLGKKTVIHYHSGEAKDHLRRFSTAVPILKLADALVTPSHFLVEVFREFNLTAVPIPNVVDVKQFSFRARTSLRPILLCTRGFHEYYGIDIVVRAFAEVQRTFPEATLDLVGGGPLEPAIRALVADLRLRGVNFAGVASRKQIAGHYDRADIFINGSRLDNMPVSILEAFACGTPVVSTAPEGMSHLVDHERTGLLSPPEDYVALARNVIRVLKEADLASRLAQNAREEMSRYSWQAVRPQWLEIYRGITEPRIRNSDCECNAE